MRYLLICIIFLAFFCKTAAASSILVSSIPFTTGTGNSGYGYAKEYYSDLTRILNDATDNNVDVVGTLDSLNLMLNYDTIWLDHRGSNLNPPGGTLSSVEIDNLTTYITSGGRVVMFGENRSWMDWNQQILSTVGGTYSGLTTNDISAINDFALGSPEIAFFDGDQRSSSISAHYLTQGVEKIPVPTVGIADFADHATQLFDLNFITLWNENVLSILDVNILGSFHHDADVQSEQFITNVAYWAAHEEDFIPWYDGRVTEEQSFLTENITFGDTVTFDYIFDFEVEPMEYSLEVLWFNGTELPPLGWNINIDGSPDVWQSTEFYVPSWGQGETAQLMFILWGSELGANPIVYLRNITSVSPISGLVPEPVSMFLFGTGIAALVGLRIKRKK